MIICFFYLIKVPDPDRRIKWIVKTDDDISVDWKTFTRRLLDNNNNNNNNINNKKNYNNMPNSDTNNARQKSFDNEERLFCHVILKNRLPMRKKSFKLWVFSFSFY